MFDVLTRWTLDFDFHGGLDADFTYFQSWHKAEEAKDVGGGELREGQESRGDDEGSQAGAGPSAAAST